MTVRRKQFPEVLDRLLTTLVGGVAAEEHPFPPPGSTTPPFRQLLERPPAVDVVAVYGARNGESHLFRKDVDYTLRPDGGSIEWPAEGAEYPDAGTLVEISYAVRAPGAPLTDLHVGSVARTLAESIAVEIAGLYAQLQAVYDAAFVDTATGSSLDNVVALLGIERVRGGRPAGEVEFTRAPGSPGTIAIPAGTRVMTADGNVEYETTETVSLAQGQGTIRVVARDLEANDFLAAGSLTVLPVPIAGITGVTNPAPTALSAQDETDAELRTRAKSFLHGSERATLGALKEAVARQQITADVTEVVDADGRRVGRIEITPHVELLAPELQQRLLTAIEDARPAGVHVTLQGAVAPKKVDLELRLTTVTGLLEQDLRAAQRAARDAIGDYFARLPAREAGSVTKLVGLVLGVTGIEDVRIVSATVDGDDVLDAANGVLAIDGFPTVLGELQIADPSLPTLVTVLVTYPKSDPPSQPPDRAAIQAALTATITYLNGLNASEPTGVDPRRTISYGKLLRVTPLPGKAGETLESFDTAASPPALPDETSTGAYRAQFVFALGSGLSRILAVSSDQYELTPFERLALAAVEVQEQSG
jgi:baseplate J-like protein